MAELPTGTVTFMLTDLEGSTRLWEARPAPMETALVAHDAILREAVVSHRGAVIDHGGDGMCTVFASASDAVGAGLQFALGIAASEDAAAAGLLPRVALHAGDGVFRADGRYVNQPLNRCARLLAAGHGGQILVSESVEALVRSVLPPDVVLVDLGAQRLRDLVHPIGVFQVVHPKLQGRFPPLRSLDAFPTNLVAQLSSFVGREHDIAEIAHVLQEKRLVTLTGVGGVGKTRLALQVAAEVVPRFAEGAWLCELAAVREPAGVVDAVASVFRVTARPGLSLEESLVAYLGDQELLLVLDNCEHVLRPVTTLVRAIEASCPRVRVLATSREGLGIRGEQNLTVSSLELPDDMTDLEVMESCEAVRLFVDRAQGAKASFAIDATNAEDVAQVCRRLDGVPLAIELAAARITAMNPGELARRLDRRFRLLTGGDRDAIERHQTLRATIDWSYDLLTEPEQRLLDRLSVFAGGCTLVAAEAVCAGDPIDTDDVFDLLASLVARSLVVADDSGSDTRYRLLETIRQYGEERLAETGDPETVRVRHCDYYSEFARLVESHSYGPGQVEWGARLARERDNLHAAMALALGNQDAERALALLCNLPASDLQVNDLVVFDAEAVLALPGAAEHPASAVALLLAGYQAGVRGNAPLALEFCDQALAAEQRLGPTPDSHLAAWSSMLRAGVGGETGSFEESAAHHLEAARQCLADGIPAMAAASLGTAQGLLAWVDPVAALQRGTEALDLARQSGQPAAITWTLLTLAQTVAADDPNRARTLLNTAVQHAATLDYENAQQLGGTVFTATLLEAWPIALRHASRALHHQLRSGAIPLAWLPGILSVAARGLAEQRPEPAAVLHGTVGPLMRRVVFTAATPDATFRSGAFATMITKVRRDTTQILVATLGEPRMRELRAQGEAMDEDQTCTYGRRYIDQYLATIDATHND